MVRKEEIALALPGPAAVDTCPSPELSIPLYDMGQHQHLASSRRQALWFLVLSRCSVSGFVILSQLRAKGARKEGGMLVV